MADQDTGATPDPTAGATPAPSTGATPDTTSDATSDAGTPLGEGGIRALEAERKARRESEQRAQQAEARLAGLEAASLRREVATTKGVPDHLLRGKTREEMEAMADQLLEWKNEGRPDPGKLVGRPQEAPLVSAFDRPGSEQPDAGKIADQIMSRRRGV